MTEPDLSRVTSVLPVDDDRAAATLLVDEAVSSGGGVRANRGNRATVRGDDDTDAARLSKSSVDLGEGDDVTDGALISRGRGVMGEMMMLPMELLSRGGLIFREVS